MAVEIRVPSLGELVVEATILRWLKKEGESVSNDDILVELETDKVNVELPAGATGVLKSIAHKEGDTVAINDVLATVESNGAVATAVSAPSAVTPSLPTSPATSDDARTAPAENGRKPFATPVAEKMAAENGLELAQLAGRGTGAGGKITIDDVKNFLQSAPTATAPAPVAAKPAVETVAAPVTAPSVAPTPIAAPANLPPMFAVSETRREERIPMSRRRQAIAANLKQALNTAAMLTTFNEVDMSAVMEVRKRRRDAFKERYGVNLGFMSFFTKATIGALKAFPYLNAEIQDKEIVLKHYYDIGIAVGATEGLVVPVVRDADQKTFADIEKAIGDLAARARENKLTLPELQGGTFTITNGGVFGSLMSTPILNTPQVGILGLHKIEERAVVVAGQIVVKPMMYLALSYDHRIVDGSEAVRFLVRVKELIEDPESLLLEG